MPKGDGKMIALLRRDALPDVSARSVGRAVRRALGLFGARRDKCIQTTIPAKDGNRVSSLSG